MGMFEHVNIILKNNYRLIRSMAGMFLAKCLAMIVQLLSVPAYLLYFQNDTVLGVWYSIFSFVNIVLLFDLGLGNGLRNKLAYSLEVDDDRSTKVLISSAYQVVLLVSIVAIVLVVASFRFIDWNLIMNVKEEVISRESLALCLSIVFIGISLYFTLKLITSILYALQRPAIINLLMITTSLIILVFLRVDKSVDPIEKLLRVSVCQATALNLPPLLATIVVFMTSLRNVRPSIKSINSDACKGLLTLGASFLLLQTVTAVIGNTNELLISWFINPIYVVPYQTYYRIFNIFVSVFGLLVTPLWSATTQKLAKQEYRWIYKCHLAVNIVAITIGLVMMSTTPLLQPLIDIWLGKDSMQIEPVAAIGFVLCTSLMMVNNANTSIANGLGWLKTQLICLTIGAVINVPLAYLFVRLTESWTAIEYANAVSLIPICIVQPVYIRKKLKRLIEKDSVTVV